MKVQVGDRIWVKKILSHPPEGVCTPTMEEWDEREVGNNYTLPVEYHLKGFCIEKPEVGYRMVVQRYERNGIKIEGIFWTTPVTKIEEEDNHVLVHTKNSTYRVEHDTSV